MEKYDFPIRSYGWQELALLYNPNITSGAATKRLRTWIMRNSKLHDELKQTGWESPCYNLTPRQVKLIISYLGEP